MSIILDNLEIELINKLKNRAKNKGISLAEEIKIILKKTVDESQIKTTDKLGWSEEFFELTAGSCEDDPIIIDEGGINSSLDENLDNVFNG